MSIVDMFIETEESTYFFLITPFVLFAAGFVMGVKKDLGTGLLVGSLIAFLTAMLFSPIYRGASYPTVYGFDVISIFSGLTLLFGIVYYFMARVPYRG